MLTFGVFTLDCKVLYFLSLPQALKSKKFIVFSLPLLAFAIATILLGTKSI